MRVNNKLIDILFVIAFIIMLLIPISKINLADKSKVENRYLAKFPPLYKQNRLYIDNFGSKFDAWLSDRFNMRYELIKFNRFCSCIPNIYYCFYKDAVFDKRNNVLYKYGFFGLTDIAGDKKYDKIVFSKNVQKLNDWCKKNNIKLYILIVPRQSDFIKHNVPNSYYKNVKDIGEELIKYAQQNTDAKIVYPYNEMMEVNKKTPAFFKTDHHWTHSGAYAGYKALIKQIQKDFPDVKMLQESELEKSTDKRVKIFYRIMLNPGSVLRFFCLPEWYISKILDTDYIYYSVPKRKWLSVTRQSSLPDFDKEHDYIYRYNFGSNKKVILIGNSYTGNLVEFLPYSFKEVVSLSDNYRGLYFTKYEKLVQNYKPDIIIINVHTVNTVVFYNLYEKIKGEK